MQGEVVCQKLPLEGMVARQKTNQIFGKVKVKPDGKRISDANYFAVFVGVPEFCNTILMLRCWKLSFVQNNTTVDGEENFAVR